MVNSFSPQQIVLDNVVEKLISMPEVIELMRDALTDLEHGNLIKSIRTIIGLNGQSLVVTPGKVVSAHRNICGARVYLQNSRRPQGAELTFVFSPHDGELKGIITGSKIGEWRTGAIGGLAIDLLSPRDARKLGVIGTGRQAKTQVLGALAVRRFQEIMVYSPTKSHRDNFVRDISEQTGSKVVAANSACDAVQRAEVIITATNSSRPILEASWLAPDVHLNHVGPKRAASCELPSEVICGANLLVSDSIAQAQALDREFAWVSELMAGKIHPLSEWIGSTAKPQRSGRSVFISLGLAGTELYLAEELLSRYSHLPPK
jgi:alanine dehydrogenase